MESISGSVNSRSKVISGAGNSRCKIKKWIVVLSGNYRVIHRLEEKWRQLKERDGEKWGRTHTLKIKKWRLKELTSLLRSCDSRASTGSFSACLPLRWAHSMPHVWAQARPVSSLPALMGEKGKPRVRFRSSLYQRLLQEGACSQVIAFSGNVLQTGHPEVNVLACGHNPQLFMSSLNFYIL